MFVEAKAGLKESWTPNIFLLAEFLIISAYLLQDLDRRHERRWSIGVMLACACAFTLISIQGSSNDANYEGGAWFYLCIVVLSLRGLYKLLAMMPVLNIERSPTFFVCAGFLLYAAGAMILLLFNHYFHESAEGTAMMRKLWRVLRGLNIIKNLSIAYTLHLSQKVRN